jgi:glucose 1-dehydrogenase
VGVLAEPASVLAKAWDHIERIGHRAAWKPRNVLITGAGPIGLLGALMGAQRGLEVHVLDRVESGPKPELVKQLGAHYHAGSVNKIGLRPDIIIECTGAAPVIGQCMEQLGNDGIMALVGVSSHGQKTDLDLGTINRTMVLDNQVIFGTVNAGRGHWEAAVKSLQQADRGWLSRLISRKEKFANWQRALERRADDIKVVIELS